jgi:hypothetical protein
VHSTVTLAGHDSQQLVEAEIDLDRLMKSFISAERAEVWRIHSVLIPKHRRTGRREARSD